VFGDQALPRPTGGAYSAPTGPLAEFKGSHFTVGKRRQGWDIGERGEIIPLPPISGSSNAISIFAKSCMRLLGIKWYDKISNAKVRKGTGMAKLEEIVKERRLRWLGHVIRMEDCRIPNQALNWNLSSMKTMEKLEGHYLKGHRIELG